MQDSWCLVRPRSPAVEKLVGGTGKGRSRDRTVATNEGLLKVPGIDVWVA